MFLPKFSKHSESHVAAARAFKMPVAKLGAETVHSYVNSKHLFLNVYNLTHKLMLHNRKSINHFAELALRRLEAQT